MLSLRLCISLLGMLAFPAATVTRPLLVTNAEELAAALKEARPGDHIRLAPSGEFGVLLITRSFTDPVTIESVNQSKPGHFTAVKLIGAQNIKLVDVDISRIRGAEPDYAKLIEIRNSSDISFMGVHIHGSLDADPSNDMWGLYCRSSARLILAEVTIEETNRAIVLDRCTDSVVENSEIKTIRTDGVDLSGVRNVKIRWNRIEGFHQQPGDHSDAIQMWTTGQERGVINVQILDNLIVAGPSGRAQGIFIGDELRLFSRSLGHSQVLIRGNTLIGTGWHGIAAMAPVEGLIIDGNTLLHVEGSDVVKSNWIKAESGRVENNIAARFLLSSGVEERKNEVVKSASPKMRSKAVAAWLSYRSDSDSSSAARAR